MRAPANLSLPPSRSSNLTSLGPTSDDPAVSAAAAFAKARAGGGDFRALDVIADGLGMTHVRLQRTLGGYPVQGQVVVVHLNAQDQATGMSGALAPVSGAPTSLRISSNAAVSAARGPRIEDRDLMPGSAPTLCMLPMTSGEARLAYHVSLIQGFPQPRRVDTFVDAATGEVLQRHEVALGMLPAQAAATGASLPKPFAKSDPALQPGWGNSMYSGAVPLSTTKLSTGGYRLLDPTRNGSETVAAQLLGGADQPVDDNNNIWGETSDDPDQRAGIDAHYAMQMTWDFYKNFLGRLSVDGKGEPLKSVVHYGYEENNAFWDGVEMNYGDGDGKTYGPFVALEVAGHEITHGVTDYLANFNSYGEAGALNEGFSDIMGTGVEWYASQQNPNVHADWALGSQIYTPDIPGDAPRYMDDPTRDGHSIDNYRNYPSQTEVHYAAGIVNNAFYLTSQGGTNKTSGLKVGQGIGIEKSLKIYYRALAIYLTPESKYSDARKATIQAAKDLYGQGSAEQQAIEQAWTAVGVA